MLAESFALDIEGAGFDQANWNDGTGKFEKMLNRLQELDGKSKKKSRNSLNQIRDILIAETAIKNHATLVSGDDNLRRVVSDFGGSAVRLFEDVRPGRTGREAQCEGQAEMTEEELDKKVEEIGLRIRSIMDANGLTEIDVGKRYGAPANTIGKMLKGNSKQWAKLAYLAPALGTNPNEILGFPVGDAREAVKGLIEAVAMHFGRSTKEAASLAEDAAKALDSPAVRNSHTDLRGAARSVGIHIIGHRLKVGSHKVR